MYFATTGVIEQAMPNTTDIGYVNNNGQQVVAKTDLKGSDHNQYIYILACKSPSRSSF